MTDDKIPSREMTITVGDYWGDGHGVSNRYIVTMSGDDVSDEAVRTSYAAAVQSAGFGVYDVVSNYQETRISRGKWESMREVWQSGSEARENSNSFGRAESIFCEFDPNHDEYEIDFNSVDFIMAFVGFRIPNFAWKFVEFPPSLVGWLRGATLIEGSDGGTTFGYGLMAEPS